MTQMATMGGVEVIEIALLVTGDAGDCIYERCKSTATVIGRHVEECMEDPNHSHACHYHNSTSSTVVCNVLRCRIGSTLEFPITWV